MTTWGTDPLPQAVIQIYLNWIRGWQSDDVTSLDFIDDGPDIDINYCETREEEDGITRNERTTQMKLQRETSGWRVTVVDIVTPFPQTAQSLDIKDRAGGHCEGVQARSPWSTLEYENVLVFHNQQLFTSKITTKSFICYSLLVETMNIRPIWMLSKNYWWFVIIWPNIYDPFDSFIYTF